MAATLTYEQLDNVASTLMSIPTRKLIGTRGCAGDAFHKLFSQNLFVQEVKASKRRKMSVRSFHNYTENNRTALEVTIKKDCCMFNTT